MEKKRSRVDEILEACDRGLELMPVADHTVIEENAWEGLQQSVEQGWMTQEEAEGLYYQWFNER